jgi:hypothetical protein
MERAGGLGMASVLYHRGAGKHGGKRGAPGRSKARRLSVRRGSHSQVTESQQVAQRSPAKPAKVRFGSQAAREVQPLRPGLLHPARGILAGFASLARVHVSGHGTAAFGGAREEQLRRAWGWEGWP